MISYSNGYATILGSVGDVIPNVVSRDPTFVRLVRNLQRFRNSGRLSDDDALASISELVDVAVEAALFTLGTKPAVDLNAFDTDDEADNALNGYIASIYVALGEPSIARLFLEDREEFERRRRAGSTLAETVGARQAVTH